MNETSENRCLINIVIFVIPAYVNVVEGIINCIKCNQYRLKALSRIARLLSYHSFGAKRTFLTTIFNANKLSQNVNTNQPFVQVYLH